MKITANEREIVEAIGFDLETVAIVKAYCSLPILRLFATDSAGEGDSPANGLSIAVQDRREAVRLCKQLNDVLVSRGYRAFSSMLREIKSRGKSEELAILKTTDDLEIIRLRSTSGSNYRFASNDIIAQVRNWKTRCVCEVIGAAVDWVAITFSTTPHPLCEFAEEVYRFCPDSVTQGVGLMREADHPQIFAAARLLCPSLSHELMSEVEQQRERFLKLPMPPMLRDKLLADSTPVDMGVRLLAYHILNSKELFLWWD